MLLFIPLAFADCPDSPPRLSPPWVHVERTPGGDVVARGRRKRGEPHGTWCHWAPYGRLIQEVTWDRGVRDGPVRSWRPDGEVVGAYRDGERHGWWTERTRTGTVRREGAYVDGEEEGPWTEFGGSGAYLHGERHGVWTFDDRVVTYDRGALDGVRRRFDEDGDLIAEETFVDGAIDGPVRTLEDGVETRGVLEGDVKQGEWVVTDSEGVRERGHYVDGEKTGVWTVRGGEVVSTTTWAGGRRHGPYQVERAGRVVSEGSYVDDVKSGRWVEVDASGKTWEMTFRDGELHGLYRVTDASGAVDQEGAFVDGRREGEWRVVASNGAVTSGRYVGGAKQGVWTVEVDGQWEPAYDDLAELQMGWVEGPDADRIAEVAAITADMVFTQPVVHELGDLEVPTLLVIGDRDRTALGRDRVSDEVRATLGRYDQLGPAAHAAIPDSELMMLEGIGHIPQYEAPDAWRAALLRFLAHR